MKICGLQKTTLLDFPGHIAATIFTGGCNFCCPFCHNGEILSAHVRPQYTESQVLSFLAKRASVLEGVCITGGEPTLQPDLAEFIEKIKQMGYLVKLDSNGYRPEILKELCRSGLIDYVAMDIKSSPENYKKAAGVPELRLSPVEESVEFLLKGSVPYEFRTTAVKGLHTEQDFSSIGTWISGAERYFIQNFKESENMPLWKSSSSEKPILKGFTKEELTHFLSIVKPFVTECGIRGIDN